MMFSIKELSDLEDKDQYNVRISNRFAMLKGILKPMWTSKGIAMCLRGYQS
jgi:hypothetical protein